MPEQLFSTPDQPAEGVSAVKALQLASQQGQKIYHITAANKTNTLPNIHQDGLTLTEIQQGLNAGKEVIVHTDPISVPGWSGAGYIIFDPQDGSGAYGDSSRSDSIEMPLKCSERISRVHARLRAWRGS